MVLHNISYVDKQKTFDWMFWMSFKYRTLLWFFFFLSFLGKEHGTIFGPCRQIVLEQKGTFSRTFPWRPDCPCQYSHQWDYPQKRKGLYTNISYTCLGNWDFLTFFNDYVKLYNFLCLVIIRNFEIILNKQICQKRSLPISYL